MSLFKRKELKRLDVNQIKEIVEEVLAVHSPEDLEQLRKNVPDEQTYILILMGTPYWFCTQFLDRYVVAILGLNMKEKGEKLMYMNIKIFESILDEREFAEKDAREKIKESVKANFQHNNYTNAATSFVFDCLSEIYRYEATHNPIDPNPSDEQIYLNTIQFRNVIKSYIKARNETKVTELFNAQDI